MFGKNEVIKSNYIISKNEGKSVVFNHENRQNIMTIGKNEVEKSMELIEKIGGDKEVLKLIENIDKYHFMFKRKKKGNYYFIKFLIP